MADAIRIRLLMALRPCKECGQQISNAARVCPHCGKKLGTSTAVGCLTVLFAIFFVGMIFNAASNTSSIGSSSNSSRTESPKTIALQQTSLNFNWRKEGFGTVMEGDFTITNNSPYTVKDIEISCTHFGKSGTKIDSNTRTIYDIVKAHSKRTFRNFSMGFIHSQAVSSNCQIADLQIQ